jgi:hypothetical protein
MWHRIIVPPRTIPCTTTGAPTQIITRTLGNKVPRPTPIRIIIILITTIHITVNRRIISRHITITPITINLINHFLFITLNL